ncbi:Charged multivesicular body protein 7 [Polyrhizophydium stewartii]|uniref:Charged multivesicular body protein 7 n=1 Tax=Polyrhizophydium stewartii TaxID=2732419 RepID=A0ABR4MZZ6_9FUNG
MQAFLATLPEYSSRDKLSFLFAEFPAERTAANSTSFDSALGFWAGAVQAATARGLLLAATDHGPSALACQCMQLHRRFAAHGMAPLGMDTVLTALVASGAWVRLEDFMAGERSAAAWLVNTLMIAPLSWTLGKLVGTRPKPPTETRQILVCKQLVSAAAEAVMDHLDKTSAFSTDRIMDLADFESLCNASGAFQQPVSALDMRLVLKHLKSDGRAAFELAEAADAAKRGERRGDVIKMAAGRRRDANLGVSETDRGVVTIKATIRTLAAQTAKMDERIQELDQQTRKALTSKLRVRALALLRQRKAVEAASGQRMSSLETLEGILRKIQGSETEAEILSAFDSGTAVLRSLVSDKNLSVERVEATMADLADALAEAADTEQAFEAGKTAVLDAHGVQVDDGELEAELDALMERDRVSQLEGRLADLSVAAEAVPASKETEMDPAGDVVAGTAERVAQDGDAGASADKQRDKKEPKREMVAA